MKRAFDVVAAILTWGLISCNSEDKGKSTSSVDQQTQPKFKTIPSESPGRNSSGQGRNPAHLSDSDLTNLIQQLKPRGSVVKNPKEFSDALAELARRSPEKALLLFSSPDAMPTFLGFASVTDAVCQKNPELLQKWLSNNLDNYNGTEDYDILLSTAYGSLGKYHPDEIASCLATLEAKDASKAIEGAFFGLGSVDPKLAINMAISTLAGSDLQRALSAIANASANSNPLQGINAAKKIDNPSLRSSTLSSVLSTWLSQDEVGAFAEISKMDRQELSNTLAQDPYGPGTLSSLISEKDPRLLIEIIDSIIPTSANKDLFVASIHRTICSNTKESLAAVERLPDGSLKNELYEVAFSALAQHDQASAISTITEISDPAIRQLAIKGVASRVGSAGLNATIEALGNLSEADQSFLLTSAFPSIASHDTSSAAKFLEEIDSSPFKIDSGSRPKLFASVGEQMANNDWQSAQKWLTQLPDSDQPYAMSGMASSMVHSNFNELNQLLNQSPRDRVWASGVKVLIQSIQHSDPESAKAWVSALKEANLD